MRVVTLFDTYVCSDNLGDQIIMEAVRGQLDHIIPDAQVYSVASHQWAGNISRSLIRNSNFALVGGTNLLNSHMWYRPMWRLSPLDGLACRDIVLMGCGWYQYQRKPDPYTRWLLGRVLSKKYVHSVRDTYTKNMLATIGITNVINTGCPTLWDLNPERCRDLPREKADHVVTTINTYLPNAEEDRRLIETLHQHYETVSLWIQTDSDYAYARKLNGNLNFINPSLKAFDDLLTSDISLDYVGNRLHAGIRALQKGRRAIIVEIDNRAREMGRDFGLPTVEREDFTRLTQMIHAPLDICITPPRQAIDRWKSQFNEQDTA